MCMESVFHSSVLWKFIMLMIATTVINFHFVCHTTKVVDDLWYLCKCCMFVQLLQDVYTAIASSQKQAEAQFLKFQFKSTRTA